MKIDSFLQIELRSVYKGLTKVPEEKVLELYKSRKVPIRYIDYHPLRVSVERIKFAERILQLLFAFHRQPSASKMIQLADMFSVPEMSLLCNITEYFEQNNIHYHPEILFQDVKVIILWI